MKIHNIGRNDTNQKIWSLESLASLNMSIYNQNNDSSVFQTEGTNSANNGSDTLSADSTRAKATADVLLQDVNHRLAKQYDKCVEMINQVRKIDEKGMKNNGNSSNVNMNNRDSKRGTKKVIKAVNQSLNTFYHPNKLRDWMDHMKVINLEKQKAIKGLNNLEVLHSDTFKVIFILVNIYSVYMLILSDHF